MHPSPADDLSLAVRMTGPAEPDLPKRSKDIPLSESALNPFALVAVLSLSMGRTTDAIDVLSESESNNAGPASSSCHPVFTGRVEVGTVAVGAEDDESAVEGRASPRHPTEKSDVTQTDKKSTRYGTMHVICSRSRGNVESGSTSGYVYRWFLPLPSFQELSGIKSD
jgi:hypothetical protein